MAKHCNLCTNEYNLEDYEPNRVISSIMKYKGFCFECAFWSWRLEHDISLILLHDDKERFLEAFYKEKGIEGLKSNTGKHKSLSTGLHLKKPKNIFKNI